MWVPFACAAATDVQPSLARADAAVPMGTRPCDSRPNHAARAAAGRRCCSGRCSVSGGAAAQLGSGHCSAASSTASESVANPWMDALP
eukprot:CAMPEP_0185406374 /NCGR_PEP_ID=MMETSP1365-20130426/655_1 /TAXON_ID=38817 /ORGANISM="Gephyrocapsa oceanica, Strain RCC1303" /LENGTH=87 /DNA_ID=CAMNT_0028008735 /DNA_START=1179 /DNA_END=1438 /DNA_ORIENTATION=-